MHGTRLPRGAAAAWVRRPRAARAGLARGRAVLRPPAPAPGARQQRLAGVVAAPPEHIASGVAARAPTPARCAASRASREGRPSRRRCACGPAAAAPARRAGCFRRSRAAPARRRAAPATGSGQDHDLLVARVGRNEAALSSTSSRPGGEFAQRQAPCACGHALHSPAASRIEPQRIDGLDARGVGAQQRPTGRIAAAARGCR